jgi:hypothetical protein
VWQWVGGSGCGSVAVDGSGSVAVAVWMSGSGRVAVDGWQSGSVVVAVVVVVVVAVVLVGWQWMAVDEWIGGCVAGWQRGSGSLALAVAP